MQSFFVLFCFFAILILVIRFLYQKNDIIKFYSIGLDSGFKIKEIYLLYKAASFANLSEPCALFLSVNALNNCIAFIIRDAKNRNIENHPKIISFIDKLYKYRTKVELDPKNSHSMKTTKSLKTGQKLRIVLRGFGVFSSKVVNAGRNLVITIPLQNNSILLAGSEWIGKEITVYLKRPGDAGYYFDTVVEDVASFNGATTLLLKHTERLIRSQKRRSVRCVCNVLAQLYIVNSETVSQTAIETSTGLKCLLEDISEDGALIRIGGKGQKDTQIKIQFQLGEDFLVMYGIVRAVEYNAEINQSRLHFECLNISPKMKNQILTYVYNVMPQEEKEVLEAIEQAEQDASDADKNDEKNYGENKTNESQTEKSQFTENQNEQMVENLEHTQKFEAFLKSDNQ